MPWRWLREGRLASVLMRRSVHFTLFLSVLGATLMLVSYHTASIELQAKRAYSGRLPQLTQSQLSADWPLTANHFSPLTGTQNTDCKPRRAIFFLKTHKCGSSTVQNIMLRHGERRMLNFVLPARGNYIGSPAPFQARWVPEDLRPVSGRFDVFAHHTRLNINETRQTMQPGAAWVTILRDPVTQFESAYDYNGFQRAWNLTLQQFIALPLEQKKVLPRIGYGRFGGNQMAFDLGYDPEIIAEPTLVETMLRDLDEAFDLVMIVELMDESLELLRQLMCWSTDDVTYLTKNARFESRRQSLSASERKTLEEFLALDVTLYHHFRARLAERIAEMAIDSFLSRAEALVARRIFWRRRCVTGTAKGNELSGDQHELTDKVKGYRLSDTSDWMCSRLGMAELGYTDMIRDAQRERLAVWHRTFSLLGGKMDVPPTEDG